MSDRPGCVTVLGAGSWGTALAIQLARAGTTVRLWGRDPEQMAQMAEHRANQRYLPNIPLPEALQIEADFERAVSECNQVLVVCPSHGFAELMQRLADCLPAAAGVAWASKGFEPGSGRLLHQVAQQHLGPDVPLAVVTGPSFATEVARGLPTVVTVASDDEDFGWLIARALHANAFRAYYTEDIVGAELGGAVKNVLAVATGISDGMGLGDNARAALITRGLAEMMRLGRALKARPETLMGLAGVGDLVLTATGDQSRNRRLGMALGRGADMDQAVAEIGQVVEGVKTAEEVMRLARRHQVEMPIAEQVFAVLHQDKAPADGLRDLLDREQKVEHH